MRIFDKISDTSLLHNLIEESKLMFNLSFLENLNENNIGLVDGYLESIRILNSTILEDEYNNYDNYLHEDQKIKLLNNIDNDKFAEKIIKSLHFDPEIWERYLSMEDEYRIRKIGQLQSKEAVIWLIKNSKKHAVNLLDSLISRKGDKINLSELGDILGIGDFFVEMRPPASNAKQIPIEEIKSSELLQFLRQKGILKIQENKHKLKNIFL
ncbi:hypothetical protein [Listeria fleischmannii]|uniref:Uncharacterized protein n=1 Tax=Listeria fleischmannii FSL S10-1203 TaxID=1265822 RepID=W7D8P3_9LIST|nr:hypothetical protein [Listeria fleischmannii]EUJ43866.1 hypothetical protein MCOL2_20383 [Listeria fleischmannii FSL S10-1203]